MQFQHDPSSKTQADVGSFIVMPSPISRLTGNATGPIRVVGAGVPPEHSQSQLPYLYMLGQQNMRNIHNIQTVPMGMNHPTVSTGSQNHPYLIQQYQQRQKQLVLQLQEQQQRHMMQHKSGITGDEDDFDNPFDDDDEEPTVVSNTVSEPINHASNYLSRVISAKIRSVGVSNMDVNRTKSHMLSHSCSAQHNNSFSLDNPTNASVEPSFVYVKTVPSRIPEKSITKKRKRGSKSSTNEEEEESPQQYIDKLLRARHYSTKMFTCKEIGYQTESTPLQTASLGVKLLDVIKKGQLETLRKLLSCGLSPNPSNAFNDSAVALLLKRGEYDVFRVFMECGFNVKVADGFERNPLHHAAWAEHSSFSIVEMLLECDRNLFRVKDKHGRTPLQYLRKDKWADWMSFLQKNADRFWPVRTVPETDDPPPTSAEHNNIGLPISVDLAGLVACGKIEPEDVLKMSPEERRDHKNEGQV